jgi:D-lactate dehydrogenase
MNIAFFEIEDWEVAFLKKPLRDHTLTFDSRPLHEDTGKKLASIEVLSVFIYSQLTAELLKKMPKLQLIVTRSMGYDHIDLAYCKKHGITVCMVPTYGAYTVAEHTFALLLAISRKLAVSIERTRHGDFTLDGLRGFDLQGKTIGVIGMGNIGQSVVHIAKGFGMHVVVYSRSPSEAAAKKMKITYLSLKELLKVSDIVTLHVPLTKKTRHMINKKNIQGMKKGSVLLNTSRGGLIETEAILYGLETGIIRAAGLDVLEEECSIKEERQLLSGHFLEECDLKTALLNHLLLQKENVLVTPHNAFNSDEALQTILQTTIENITAFLHRSPVNTVTNQ